MPSNRSLLTALLAFAATLAPAVQAQWPAELGTGARVQARRGFDLRWLHLRGRGGCRRSVSPGALEANSAGPLAICEQVMAKTRSLLMVPVLLPSAFGGAYERPGTYSVRVERNGYRPWDTTRVRVHADRCGASPVQLVARLSPIP
jgi:hypothetical protein